MRGTTRSRGDSWCRPGCRRCRGSRLPWRRFVYPESGRHLTKSGLGNRKGVNEHDRYRPIGDYALIADCHTAALVSREGSIDWCCGPPRFDSGSAFARLLDYAGGGYCALAPADGGSWESKRSYIEDSFVLETTLTCGAGEVRMVDCFVLHEGDPAQHERRIVRVIEGVKGSDDSTYGSFRGSTTARSGHGYVATA